jgi:probable HAF family extracellular repeat protein
VVPSKTSFMLTAAASGYTFTPQYVFTGKSVSGGKYTNSLDTGNLWGVNFRSGLPTPTNPEYRLYSLSAATTDPSTSISTATSGRAFAINNNSTIVGAKKPNIFMGFHAYLWYFASDNLITYRDLGTFVDPKDSTKQGDQSEAHGINNNGLIVGWSNKPNDTKKYPCYWNPKEGGVIQQLASPNSNTNEALALGVNNQGEIVGNTWFYPPDAMLWACYWHDVGALIMGLTSGTGSPRANRINDQGVAVGAIDNKAARWNQGTYVDLDPSGANSEAFAPPTPNFAAAVGQKSGQACFFSSPGNITMLGSLGGSSSTAYKVNNLGQIVGQATNSAGRGRAFIWDGNKGMRDLNSLVNEPDWVLNTAYDINDKGEIVGWGWYKGGYDFAFILRPMAKPAPAIVPTYELLLLY